MSHILDNPVWSALNSDNKNISEGTDKVRFFQEDIALFVGLEENTDNNLIALYELTPDEESVFGLVSVAEINIPAPWATLHCIPLLQMVCEHPIYRKDHTAPIKNLSDEHIPQMLELTKLTNPGPFRERTIDFGHYQGIFDGDKLVAMAGQRMHAHPYAEISAVCTHPDYTGRGYAAQLMASQIKRIKEAGEIPFLHVAASNERAIKIYESIGFAIRKELLIYILKK